MPLNLRQEKIVEALRSTGQVEVETLAHEFGVTTQTVRRDLSELVERGIALRTHGGARRAVTSTAVSYDERRLKNHAAKQMIARSAARLVPDGASVAMNIGTTTEQVAEALRTHRNLTIVSNNINIVHILRGADLRALMVIGGEVRQSDGAIIGEEAVNSIAYYKVDYAIIGASAIDDDGSVLDYDLREVAVARAILANARTRILVVDVSKFDASAPHRICNVDALDHIVMDKSPSAAFARLVRAHGTALLVAGNPPQ